MYACGDEEPFVRPLEEDLTARAFDVWFDRQSMPSRNLTLHQEIRDAVAAWDRLVLVVGPKAVAWTASRGRRSVEKHMHAHQCRKRTITIPPSVGEDEARLFLAMKLFVAVIDYPTNKLQDDRGHAQCCDGYQQ